MNIIHGIKNFDEYLLVEDDGELLIIEQDGMNYENAIILTVGHRGTDLSDNYLLKKSKKTLDLLNKGVLP